MFTGPHLTDAEASDFWQINAGASNVRPADLDRSIESAGFAATTRIDLGSEWGEFGQTAYEIMLHDCLWHVYRMLGLLHGAIFVFQAPGQLVRGTAHQRRPSHQRVASLTNSPS